MPEMGLTEKNKIIYKLRMVTFVAGFCDFWKGARQFGMI
jgi:spore cortex formation protein SpoVR/YcgB (stage V sporulation)